MPRAEPGVFARACIALSGDPDWSIVLQAIEAQYEAAKEQLVVCADSEQTALKGEARALRRLLTDVRGAGQTLERLDAQRRDPARGLPSAIP